MDKSNIQEKIREIILAESPDTQIDDEEDYLSVFSDLGIDSLDLMMAMLKVTETYSVEITEEDFSEIENIQDIVKFVEGRLASA